jgi:DNA-binding response OmpR family regulator
MLWSMTATPLKILVAEDSLTELTILTDLLREEDLEVHGFGDGRTALDITRMIHPDLVILDIDLPRLNGWEVLERLRDDHRVRETAVIVVTGDTRPITAQRALDTGASDFLTKPFNSDALLACVRAAVGEERWTGRARGFTRPA